MKIPQFLHVDLGVVITIILHCAGATAAAAFLGVRPTEYLLWVILAELLTLNRRIKP